MLGTYFFSLYNRIRSFTASSTAAENPVNKATSSSNNSTKKGWFLGCNITWLTGSSNHKSLTSPSKPSFLQKIFPYFFAAAATANQDVKEANQLNTPVDLASKKQVPPIISSQQEITAEDSSTPYLIQVEAMQTRHDIALDQQIPNYISIQIPAKGSFIFSSTDRVCEQINAKLNDMRRDRQQDGSFDEDIKRKFSIRYEKDELEHPQESTPATPALVEERANKGNDILTKIGDSLFSENHQAATTLAQQLHRLNPQGLIGCVLDTVASSLAPNGTFCPQGGIKGYISFAKTDDRQLEIQVGGMLSGSSLIGNFNNNCTVVMVNSASGLIDMTIQAKIGDNGHITSLVCESAKGSYEVV